MKKIKLFVGLMALTIGMVTVGAAHASAVEPATLTTPQARGGIDLDILDKGELDGRISPYIMGVPNSGKITLHYKSNQFGAGILSKSYFIVTMPKEFEYITSQDGLLKANIKAHIKAPLIDHVYTASEMEVMTDRITFDTPKMNYVLGNKVTVDLEINYGKVLDKYPNIPIPDGNYEFKAFLSKNNLIDLTLLGDTVGHWEDPDGKAIIKD